MKFDTIFDEYVNVRKQFDGVKKNMTKDEAGGGDNK